ncbi:50S ribosomal protein L25 [Thorsellia kenyensis]|uniref:Large ribosomal subunit protein bL25 n=1 Tax=Thorsellia kenyensis TaxID=1549888 RepID=A0ABV6C8Z1_9GAMM
MLKINAEVRKEQGKSASRRLRRADKFPAIVYGGNEAAVSVELDHNQIINMEPNPAFYDVVALVIDGKEHKVKVQAVQRHPFKPKITHIDFVRQ